MAEREWTTYLCTTGELQSESNMETSPDPSKAARSLAKQGAPPISPISTQSSTPLGQTGVTSMQEKEGSSWGAEGRREWRERF